MPLKSTQQILDKLCDIIDMVFEEEMPSFTVLNYTHKALKDAGVTLEEIAPVALADNQFLELYHSQDGLYQEWEKRCTLARTSSFAI